jgi:hypothetical protein
LPPTRSLFSFPDRQAAKAIGFIARTTAEGIPPERFETLPAQEERLEKQATQIETLPAREVLLKQPSGRKIPRAARPSRVLFPRLLMSEIVPQASGRRLPVEFHSKNSAGRKILMEFHAKNPVGRKILMEFHTKNTKGRFPTVEAGVPKPARRKILMEFHPKNPAGRKILMEAGGTLFYFS